MMTKVETGSHMGMSLVQCKKVCALVLEPISTGFHPSPCFGLVVVCASSFHHCAIFWWTYFVVFAGCALLTAWSVLLLKWHAHVAHESQTLHLFGLAVCAKAPLLSNSNVSCSWTKCTEDMLIFLACWQAHG